MIQMLLKLTATGLVLAGMLVTATAPARPQRGVDASRSPRARAWDWQEPRSWVNLGQSKQA